MNSTLFRLTLALPLAALALLATQPLQAESAAEIVEKFEKEKSAALDAYLKANPDAEDKVAALSALVESAATRDDLAEMTTRLTQKYEALPKGTEADPNALIGEVVQPLLMTYLQEGETEKGMALIATAKKDLEGHEMAERINQFLDRMEQQFNKPKAPQIGDTMELAFTSTEGKEIDLAAMKGKVVLVDFWATWCPPCIHEMPNVIAAYEKFHEQGFEVIGVSLDQDEAELKRFIEERKMTWPQFFDGKGWENELAAKHGISSIPATFLIGKDGKIAHSNLRGEALEALEARVAELLQAE